MSTEIKPGDIVIGIACDEPIPMCGCKVLMIDNDSYVNHPLAMILFTTKYNISPLSKPEIEYNRKRNRLIVSDIDQYIGQVSMWAWCDNLVVKPAANICAQTYSRICAKCGQFDEYASPTPKYNNEVRCYKCCG